MSAKGYVVRGTAPGDVLHEEARDTLHAAVSTWTALVMNEAARPRIFAVAEDGTETPLPSYEEALAEIERLRADVAGMRAGLLDAAGQSRRLGAVIADPLSALEAAERRLLESARWTPGDRGFWIDPDDGTQWPREGAISDVRRRLAAKGGA